MFVFCIKVIRFSFFCLLIYIPILFIFGVFAPKKLHKNLRYKEDTFLRTKLEELADYSDVDILFIGSSHAFRSFDPRVFAQAGFNTFNLGSSAQSPLNTELILERYLDKINPKMVVYEVYPETFTSDGVESTADIISSDTIDSDILSLVCRHNNITAYNTFIFGLVKQALMLKGNSQLRLEHNSKYYIPGGYVETYSTNDQIYPGPQRKLSFRQEQVQAFERIVSNFIQSNIDYILVQTPITDSRYTSILNNPGIDSFFAKNGEYINYNRVLDLDDIDDFSDSDHLNQSGAEKLCNEFLVYLSERSDDISTN